MSDIKLEYVKWLDAEGVGPSWRHVDELYDDNNNIEGSIIISCGYILKENEEWLLIVPHFSLELKGHVQQICGEMTILKASIIERKVLYNEQMQRL